MGAVAGKYKLRAGGQGQVRVLGVMARAGGQETEIPTFDILFPVCEVTFKPI